MLRNRTYDEVAATEHSSVARSTWSPAQLISLLVGLTFVVLGGVGLARTGLQFSPMANTEVAGLAMSALFALGLIIFGAIVLGSAAVPGGNRSGMGTMGVIALAAGLVLAIQPSSFRESLAIDSSMGWLLVFAGALLLGAAMFSRTYSSVRAGSRVEQRDDRDIIV